MNLQTIFDKLTSNEVILASQIKPYFKSLCTLLEDYYNTSEIFYETDSYGMTVIIHEDIHEACFNQYNEGLNESEQYSDEGFEDFEANFFCYVGVFNKLF